MGIARRAASLPLVLLMISCGGGGGSPSPSPSPPPPPVVTPPSGLSYPAHPAFTINAAITTLAPTVTGTVTTYSISPALTAGLAIDAATGQISGTPTVLAAATNYTVTATNAGGNTTATVTIAVNDALAVVSYSSAAVSYSVGTVAANLAPTVTGGQTLSWSVDPALPAGLTLDPATGIIGGLPSVASARATYRVTAHNSGGDSHADIALSVSSGVLLKLGHGQPLKAINMNAQRVLSADYQGHVVLWNAQTAAQIFGADEALCTNECGAVIALAGPTAVLRSPSGFDVRAAADGASLGSINFPAAFGTWWRLASDGSYVVAGNSSGLTVWSPAGAVLLTRPGNYANADAFAAPSALRIGKGAAGANVIESITVPGGVASQSAAFQGAFHSWFGDGARFMSNLGNTVWVYAADATQQDLVALTTIEDLGGRGDWLWSADNSTLRIYRVGASGAPAASYPVGIIDKIVPSADTIGILAFNIDDLKVVDLSGPSPTLTDYSTPIRGLSAFAANNAGDWALGNESGVLMGEIPLAGSALRYSDGKVRAIAGNDQRIAVALASGRILYFDAATRALQGEIAFPGAVLSLSDDGSVLQAASSIPGSDSAPYEVERFYGLPSQSVLFERDYNTGLFPNYTYPWLVGATMSRSGNTVGEVFQTTASNGRFQRVVSTIAGAPIFSDEFVGDGAVPGKGLSAVHLSPSGSRSMISQGIDSPNSTVNIRNGATLVGAAPGLGVGWIDEDRALVARYQFDHFGIVNYAGLDMLNPAGQVLGSPRLPEISRFQSLGGNLIFSPEHNAVYDVSDGSTRWQTQSPVEGKGAVAAGHAVFASGSSVLVESL